MNKQMAVKTYFKGGKGIKEPVDANGNLIKEGDILTFSWFNCEDPIAYQRERYSNMIDKSDEEISEEIHKPVYVVKKKNGILFGEGLGEATICGRLYLHDFRFNETKIHKKQYACNNVINQLSKQNNT